VSLAHSAHAAAAGPGQWLLPGLVVAVPLTLYVVGLRCLRRRLGRRWSGWRTAGFLCGALLLGVAISPTLDSLAHDDARGHMAQHLLLGMFAPLALVLGAPVTLLLGSVPVTARRRAGAVLRSRVLHVLAHPVPAAVASVGSL
jgi:putative membrane protein